MVKQLQSPAQKKGISLELNLAPCPITGHAEDLEIILRNLLSNAIKFTPVGGQISIVTGANSIQIKDSRVGFADELVEKNKGKIHINSQVGQGTEIRILFAEA